MNPEPDIVQPQVVVYMADNDSLVIKDDQPVDSIFAAIQYRLLVDALRSSWKPHDGQPFLALPNVGLFYHDAKPPLRPDVMLCLDVRFRGDPRRKENLSYFIWRFGKPPNVVVELVSDRRGGEDTTKLLKYAEIGVSYYVIFDPDKHLSDDGLRSFGLQEGKYTPLPKNWLANVGLGVTLWESAYEDHPATWWLRWCDERGELIPTAVEQKERLAAKLRAAGIDPDTV